MGARMSARGVNDDRFALQVRPTVQSGKNARSGLPKVCVLDRDVGRPAPAMSCCFIERVSDIRDTIYLTRIELGIPLPWEPDISMALESTTRHEVGKPQGNALA